MSLQMSLTNGTEPNVGRYTKEDVPERGSTGGVVGTDVSSRSLMTGRPTEVPNLHQYTSRSCYRQFNIHRHFINSFIKNNFLFF